MQLVTLDFESYYAADYTLRSMTTESYVRDPRFRAHCVGIKYAHTPAVVVDPNTDTGRAYMQQAVEGNCVIAQKAQFDGLILSHHYGLRPAFWMDTLSMARLVWPHKRHHSLKALAEALGLQEKTVPYDDFKGIHNLATVPGLYEAVAAGCADDCDLTYQVFMKLLPHVPKEELELIDMTIRMFTEPCLTLDTPRMERFVNHMAQQKDSLLQQLGVTKADLRSDTKFAAILTHLGVEPATKTTAKGNVKCAFAKNDDFMRELEEHEAPHIQLLAEARLDAKSVGAETRAQRFLDMAKRGYLPVYLNYAAAHTHRWGGGDSMNWQNFTRIDYDDQGKIAEFPNQRGEIRLSIKATDEDSVIVVADASQIECRVLNRVAGQWDVLEKFAAKKDIYSELATKFYGFEVTKKNKAERGTGKQLELSCGYGAGGPTIVNTAKLGIYGPPVLMTPEQGMQARNLYRDTHAAVVGLWKEAGDVVLAALVNRQYYVWRDIMTVYEGRIYFPNGTNMDYTTLYWNSEEREYRLVTKRGETRMYGAKLIENVIQKIARDIVGQAMLRVKPHYKLAMTTHDEMAAVVHKTQADAALEMMLTELRREPVWLPNIPLDAEGGYDVRYSK